MSDFKLGLYRHYKGDYFLVLNKLRGGYLQYLDVLHPERGYFCSLIEEFDIEVSDREDNYTGQKYCFERVVSLDSVVKNATTEQLIKELRERVDSPLQELDIEGLNNCVFSSDYVVGEAYEATDDTPKGVQTLNVFDTSKEAWEYFKEKTHRSNIAVFKRTFIKQLK